VLDAIWHSTLPWKHYPLSGDNFFGSMRDHNIGIWCHMMKGLVDRTQVAHSVVNDRNGLRHLLAYVLWFFDSLLLNARNFLD
jgi:hypothetical protein